MFHKSNLGKFGENLTCDMDGYVPEAGDDWRDMKFDFGGVEETDEEIEYRDNDWWPEVIAAAEKASAKANAAVEEWRAD